METKQTTSAVSRKRRHYAPSPVIKRSVTIAGTKTSVTLEAGFWDALGEISKSKNISMAALIGKIGKDSIGSNLSSSIRLFVLQHFRSLNGKALPR